MQDAIHIVPLASPKDNLKKVSEAIDALVQIVPGIADSLVKTLDKQSGLAVKRLARISHTAATILEQVASIRSMGVFIAASEA